MTNKELVNKYYEMWNNQNFEIADTLLDNDIRFRGSLDITANGLEGFKDYAQMLTLAFPNLYHAVEMSVFENNMAAIYVTYTGKHEGKILDYEPTGHRFRYSGAAFFHFKNEKIYSINVLGDLNSLYKQIGSES